MKKSSSSSSAPDPLPELEVRCKRFEEGYETLCHILDVLGHVTAQDTVDDVCRTIVEGVRVFLGFDRVALYLWHARDDVFRGTFGTDLEGKTSDEHDLSWRGDDWPPMKKISEGDVFLKADLDRLTGQPSEKGRESHIVVLRFGETVYGILSVDNRISGRPVAEAVLNYLTVFSRIVGNAVEMSRTKTDLVYSADRFRQVAEHTREWIWEMDAEGRYTFCSPVAREILGYEAGTLVGRHYIDFVAEESREEVILALADALTAKKPLQHFLNKQIHKDGHLAVLETSGSPAYGPGKQFRGYRGLHRDVTLERQREEQLRQAQKLEIVGRLAGGMAHHYNNLLTVILTSCSLLEEKGGWDDMERAQLDQIMEAGRQAASLTEQLLAFSRRQMLLVRRLNINAVLQDVDLLLRTTLEDELELITTFAPNLADVDADADQVKHAVMRLAVNVRGAVRDMREKALAEAGDEARETDSGAELSQLIIETENVTLDEEDCRKHEGLRPGRHVLVSIVDTETVIAPDILEHIFEPFFTTKAVGEGPGLGLSSVYGAMRQMNGDVEVESEPGKGTTFKLYFPALEDEPEEGAAGRAS